MNQERLLKIILAPHVTEKSADLADANRQFVFKVAPDANKREVKGAVESLFDVKVSGVQIVNLKGKAKRSGAIKGRRNDLKKAYVTLEEGYDINLADAEA